MKARHVVALLIGAALTTWVLLSCELGAVSIDQRISTFQSDLNTSSRSNVYQNWDPTTAAATYAALRDPNTSQFNNNFPPPPPNYTLSVVTESNTSAVIVQVNGPVGIAGASPYFLSLNMDTYNGNDWRIVVLSYGLSYPGSFTPLY